MKPMLLEENALYELLEILGRGCCETRHLILERGADEFTLKYAAEVLVLLSDDLHEAIRRVRLENNPNAIHKRAHLSPPQIAEDMSKARSANRATSLLPERKSS